MRVVITGGAGFVGQFLARQLLARGVLIDAQDQRRDISEIFLFDHQAPAFWQADVSQHCQFVQGNMQDGQALADLVTGDDALSVFHLASIVSGEGEEDFTLAMNVNLHGNLYLLEALRARETLAKIVFASSIATFGGDMPDMVGDITKQTPQTTYGMTKAIG
ncbi:MAG: NAD-dependent epimerase/dehydratase family protein, partial [Pseudomonadota bacterium]